MIWRMGTLLLFADNERLSKAEKKKKKSIEKTTNRTLFIFET